jgi:dTDP-4-dehydrorhamnose 3,5-epimerase
MLPGIAAKPLRRFEDERGFFTKTMRRYWSNVFQDEVLQADISVSYPGMMPAWNKHERRQVDRFPAVHAAMMICANREENRELDEIICTGDNSRW